jgi:hypothetical protein
VPLRMSVDAITFSAHVDFPQTCVAALRPVELDVSRLNKAGIALCTEMNTLQIPQCAHVNDATLKTRVFSSLSICLIFRLVSILMVAKKRGPSSSSSHGNWQPQGGDRYSDRA